MYNTYKNLYNVYIYIHIYIRIDHGSPFQTDKEPTLIKSIQRVSCVFGAILVKTTPQVFPSKRAAPPVFPLFWTSCASYAWGEKLHGTLLSRKVSESSRRKNGGSEPFPPSCLFHF